MKEIMHDSDCAVHNEPAYRADPCDCGALAKYEHRYVTYLYQRGCSFVSRRKNAVRFWLSMKFCQAKRGASQKLYLSCYRLLFGSHAMRASWYGYRRLKMVQPLWGSRRK